MCFAVREEKLQTDAPDQQEGDAEHHQHAPGNAVSEPDRLQGVLAMLDQLRAHRAGICGGQGTEDSQQEKAGQQNGTIFGFCHLSFF